MSKKETKLEKILIIPDCHHPYVDKKAWELLLKVGKDFKPNHVVILGDFADFFDVSSHSKDPSRRFKFNEEIDAAKKALDEVIALGAKNNVFVAGNHEDRLYRYVCDNAPEFNKVVTIAGLLDLKEKGFKYTPYKQSYKLGKMNFTHDTGSAGRYAHYKSLDTFQHNVVIGHTHRLGYAVEGNAQGERHLGTSLGWLGDFNEVDYMHKIKATRDWCHGFGLGYLDPRTDNVYVVPVPIVGSSCLVEGKLYKV